MPIRPTGTDTRKMSRHEIGARTPPSTRPIVEPATNAMFMMPRAVPRWPGGKVSVTIALVLPSSIAPPRPCPMRITINQRAPAPPCIHEIESKMENTVKTTKPRLYTRTRP